MSMKSIATMLGLVAVAMGPVPASIFPMAGIDAAHAEKGGKGNSGNAKSDSKSDSKSDNSGDASTESSQPASKKPAKNTKGALASELKGLNAVKANPNALDNADPNSQVGRIAAYRDAAVAASSAAALVAQATAARDALTAPARSVADIDAAVALLDPTLEGYDAAAESLAAERQAAVDYEAAVAQVTDAIAALLTAQETEDAALLTASGGRELSDEAIAYIRNELNI